MSKESYRKKKLRKKDKEFKYNYNQKSSSHCTSCETRAGGKIIYKNSTEAKKSIPKTKKLIPYKCPNQNGWHLTSSMNYELAQEIIKYLEESKVRLYVDDKIFTFELGKKTYEFKEFIAYHKISTFFFIIFGDPLRDNLQNNIKLNKILKKELKVLSQPIYEFEIILDENIYFGYGIQNTYSGTIEHILSRYDVFYYLYSTKGGELRRKFINI